MFNRGIILCVNYFASIITIIIIIASRSLVASSFYLSTSFVFLLQGPFHRNVLATLSYDFLTKRALEIHKLK